MAEDARAAGDWRRVGESLAPLKKLAPELADVNLRLAEMHLVNGRVAEAKRSLEMGRKLGADSGLYWLITAGLKATLKDYEGGAEAAREAAKRWPVPRVYAALAANEMNLGKRPEAEAAIRKAYILNPYDAEVRRIYKQIFPGGLP
jgi:tetratricopeptide (TPR) repeat protein